MPAAWLPLTEADVLRIKAAPMLAAARTAARAAGQVDPLADAIASVVREIRNEIAGCKSNVLDANEALLPPELISLAARKCMRELQSRINALSSAPLGDQEKEEWRQDMRRLERIAACELPVTAPLSPIAPAVQTSAVRPVITGRRRRYGRDQQDGL